jgi:hypothetical protein
MTRPAGVGLLATAAVLIAAVVGFGVGFYLANNSGSIQTECDVTGTVTQVSGNGSKACLTPDSGGDNLCGVVVQVPGNPPIAVGDHVSVTQVWVVDGADKHEVLIVREPLPVPSR